MHPAPHAAPCSSARRMITVALALLVAALGHGAALGEESRAEFIRAKYSKFEYRVPMRDGVTLFTSVYIPQHTKDPAPMLLVRTPYSVRPYGADRYRRRLGPSEAFEKEGFIFVFQDVRGTFMSEGEFVNMRPHAAPDGSPARTSESTDTYDTIQWLLEHVPGHNGRVGQWGISYPGFYASAGMIDSHPALRAVSPQAPIADWFWDDMHHHGAFILPLAFNFFASFGQVRDGLVQEPGERFDHGTPDGYQFFLDLGPLSRVEEEYFKGSIPFWQQIVEHPNYDSFWQARNILPHLKNIKAAVMVVGGFFDSEDLYGPLQTYRHVEEQNPGIENMLVMGPWSHGAWNRTEGAALGEAHFGFATAPAYRDRVEFPFFMHHLKEGVDPDLPEAMIFETGANRWRHFDAWPPAEVQRQAFYMGEKGSLSRQRPDADTGADSYLSDPAKPVPYTMEITTAWARDYMTEDQRFAAWRPDVLVYRGPVLEQDLTVAGPVTARLWVSTTGSAADWVVKLIDVNPPSLDDPDAGNAGGRQTLVRGEVFRGRFRESYEKPVPFIPWQVAEVSFDLQDVLHTFKRGHRLMVQVQSTWFPFVDRNPQTWVPNIFQATDADFKAQTHTVHRNRIHASQVVMGVLPATGSSPR